MTIINSDRTLIWPLSELVTVRPRFLRSVNLERDFALPGAGDGYVPTPSAQAALERILAGVDTPSLRAWSITGPYGTGKSAFALRLTQTLADAGFRPVLVTGGREPLAQSLLRGLEGTSRSIGLPQGGEEQAAQEQAAQEQAAQEQAAQEQAAQEQAAQEQAAHGGGGLLLIIDELGKALEYAAPPLRNELINRRQLTSVAAAARRGRAPHAV